MGTGETIHYFWGGGDSDYSCSNEEFVECQTAPNDTEVEVIIYQLGE